MLHQTEFRAMGCRIFAALDSPSQPELFNQIPQWFDEWEAHLSRFHPDSELNRINHANGAQTQVSPVFADVLEAAIAAEALSDGLVTPVLLDALVSAGYDRDFELVAGNELDAQPQNGWQPTPQLAEIDWNPNSRLLTLPPDLHLDFGGVAKGWAAHQASMRLKDFGATLVDGQGDIAVTAPRADGSAWRIGIADPFDPQENVTVLNLFSGGVATSGRDHRNWLRDGLLMHHIIDPRTGLPAQTDILTATAIAPNVMQAEAVTKTLLILGSHAALDWLAANPEFDALLILEDGQVLTSENFERYL